MSSNMSEEWIFWEKSLCFFKESSICLKISSQYFEKIISISSNFFTKIVIKIHFAQSWTQMNPSDITSSNDKTSIRFQRDRIDGRRIQCFWKPQSHCAGYCAGKKQEIIKQLHRWWLFISSSSRAVSLAVSATTRSAAPALHQYAPRGEIRPLRVRPFHLVVRPYDTPPVDRRLIRCYSTLNPPPSTKS